MKTLTRIIITIALLLGGFGAGFTVGNIQGFDKGCEWALVQADILAREEGLATNVLYAEGTFQIIQKQPADLYRRAWQMAEKRGVADMQTANSTMKSGEMVAAVFTSHALPFLLKAKQ